MTETEVGGLERIVCGNTLLAVIVRHTFHHDGIQFFTPDDFSQQLAYMKRPAGYDIAPHVHKLVRREVLYTQETLLIRRGKVHISFFSEERKPVCTRTVETGDVVLLVSGGHGFRMLEESEIIEVKQGPYAGDDDKVRFDPAE
jgi:mannose-6-phosphate isomerase-like protein (cupin superfamily)